MNSNTYLYYTNDRRSRKEIYLLVLKGDFKFIREIQASKSLFFSAKRPIRALVNFEDNFECREKSPLERILISDIWFLDF